MFSPAALGCVLFAGQRNDVGKTAFDKNLAMRAALFAYAKKVGFEFKYTEAAEELKKQGFQTSVGSVFKEINTKGIFRNI